MWLERESVNFNDLITGLYWEPNLFQLLSNHVPSTLLQVSIHLFQTYKYELQDYLGIWPTLQVRIIFSIQIEEDEERKEIYLFDLGSKHGK